MASLFIGFLIENTLRAARQLIPRKCSLCSQGRLRNTSLVKVGSPISDGIVFVFTLLERKRVAKSEAILALLDSLQELHLEW